MPVFSEANKIEIEVYDALKSVIDPEIGINIIDLGLVYKIEYNGENGIYIEMTFSTPGCPMGDAITENIYSVLGEKFPGKKAEVKIVWEPAWSTNFVTPAGRQALGF